MASLPLVSHTHASALITLLALSWMSIISSFIQLTLSRRESRRTYFRSRAGISARNSYPPLLQELNEAVKRTGAFVLARKDVQYLLPQLQIFPPLTLCQSAAHCELNPRYRSSFSSAPSASECHYSLLESSPSPQSQPLVVYLHLPHTSLSPFLSIIITISRK